MTTVVANYRERAPEALVLDTLREHAPITANHLAELLYLPARPVVQTLNHLADQGWTRRLIRDNSNDQRTPTAYWEALT